MATYSDVETKMNAAITALDAGDFATAELRAVGALGLLAVVPIEARKEGQASGSFRYSELMINGFIDNVKKLRSRSNRGKLGIQTTRVNLDSTRCGDAATCGCGGDE